ncbi:MAG: DUF3465 domain-containing protein [Thermoanaerobaculia bacterium]
MAAGRPPRLARPRKRSPLLAVVAVLLALGYGTYRTWVRPVAGGRRSENARAISTELSRALAGHLRDVWVEGSGEVTRLLPDDNQGSRHQRFLLRLEDGQSLLVAHNLDLAPRVPVAEGDEVEFRGQLEWNDHGPLVHWTHHAPDSHHTGGWLRHQGQLYQ